jgi:arylsulfatase A-like enzyme
MSHQPNVVLILVDDMGYGDFSAFNGGLSSTPALDGLLREWKLVRPLVWQAADAPCCQPWLTVSMYAPEYFEQRGLLAEPEPERNWPAPPAAELYNIAADPNEERNLATAHPQIVSRLSRELDVWFEEVEAERRRLPA